MGDLHNPSPPNTVPPLFNQLTNPIAGRRLACHCLHSNILLGNSLLPMVGRPEIHLRRELHYHSSSGSTSRSSNLLNLFERDIYVDFRHRSFPNNRGYCLRVLKKRENKPSCELNKKYWKRAH